MTQRVLIVDDNMVSRMMIREIIKSQHPEWVFIQAASADKAIEACLESQFDYIILDLNLSGKSGLDAAPELLSSQKHAKIALFTPDIAESAKDTEINTALFFLAKPINIDEILQFVS